jgi:hypothetical protein
LKPHFQVEHRIARMLTPRRGGKWRAPRTGRMGRISSMADTSAEPRDQSMGECCCCCCCCCLFFKLVRDLETCGGALTSTPRNPFAGLRAMMLKQSDQVTHIEERMLQLETQKARDVEREQQREKHIARLEQRLQATLAALDSLVNRPSICPSPAQCDQGEEEPARRPHLGDEVWTVYTRPDDISDTTPAAEGDAASLLQADDE